jgi:xylulokinase
MGEAVTPLGPDGLVLAKSPVTFDTRSFDQCARLEATIGRKRLAHITGQPPHPMFTITKLMWWAEHDPALLRQTWKFLCFGDLVAWRLGGEPAIDFSMAARTMAFDIDAQKWSDEVLTVAGIPAEKLPLPVASGTVIGRVEPAVARQLGFPGRPLIVAGGHDQPCGALGAGATTPGEAMLSIGTTICLAPIVAHRQKRLVQLNYSCYPHVVPGQWITLAGNFTGGSLLRWYRDALGESEVAQATATGQDVYDVITEEAGDVPSPLLVLPHFAGSGEPTNDPCSKGAIVGLSFGTTRHHIVRALLEGVMFEMAVNREAIARAGIDVMTAVATGGGARSDRWLSIAADILVLPIRRAAHLEAASWGAATLAGWGAGLRPLGAETPDQREGRIVLPDPERSAFYRQRLAVYRELYGALRPLHSALWQASA